MIRSDFVSNSSSSSFIIDKSYFKTNEIPTHDKLFNAIRSAFPVNAWINEGRYITIVDMDEIRSQFGENEKITYKQLCQKNSAFRSINGFCDCVTRKKMETCVVNTDSKFVIFMGDNVCFLMEGAQEDDMTKYQTEYYSGQRIFEILLPLIGLTYDKTSKALHCNSHLG